RTDCRVEGAGVVATERTSTGGRVLSAGRIVHERVITQERVAEAEVAALSTIGSRLRRKRKHCDRHFDENWQNCCVFGLSQRIHGSSFLPPQSYVLVVCGSGRGEEPSGGKVLRLIQIRLAARVFEKTGSLSSQFGTSLNRRFKF